MTVSLGWRRSAREPAGVLEHGGGHAAAWNDDVVDEAVLLRLSRRHVVVAVDVGLDLSDRPARVVADDLDHAARRRHHLPEVDLHVAGGATGPGTALVDHDLRAREREPLARCATGKDHGCR